jgi:hypothetical protein
MTTGSGPRWKWTQVQNFQHPDHPEWDVIQWNCEDELVHGPREVAYPVNDPPNDWWYLKTKDAPGLSDLPPTIVLFRIASEPSETEPGIMVGQAAWWDDDDLESALLRLVQGLPF